MNSIEVIGWDSAAAIIKSLLENNYEVLVFSDEVNDQPVYSIQFSHREFELGFEKIEDEQ